MTDLDAPTFMAPHATAAYIVDNQRTGIMIVDGQLLVSYLNPAAENLLTRSREQTIGMPIGDVLQADDNIIHTLARALIDTQSVTVRKLHITLADRSRLVMDVSATPLPEKHALLLELQPLDIQLRFSRDDQLANQQETSLQLIRGLAHEVKNPLGGIRGAAQLLERELPAAHLREYTAIILGEVDRLRDLVDRMMRLRSTPRFSECNVHEVLERVIALTSAEFKGIELIRDYDPSLPSLVADRDQLLQACLNVVRNACQALHATSQPTITVRTRIARQVTAGRHRHRSAIRIDIQDNGPGVDPELAERIFFPMISGRPDGTGLGLALTQTIVTEHSGIIECTSMPGLTLFTMLLPITQPKGSRHQVGSS